MSALFDPKVPKMRRNCRSYIGERYKCGYILLFKSWKAWFLALVGLTRVKDRSVRKKNTESYEKEPTGAIFVGAFFDQKCIWFGLVGYEEKQGEPASDHTSQIC